MHVRNLVVMPIISKYDTKNFRRIRKNFLISDTFKKIENLCNRCVDFDQVHNPERTTDTTSYASQSVLKVDWESFLRGIRVVHVVHIIL